MQATNYIRLSVSDVRVQMPTENTMDRIKALNTLYTNTKILLASAQEELRNLCE